MALLSVARGRRDRGEAPTDGGPVALDERKAATLARIVAHMGGEVVDHAYGNIGARLSKLERDAMP